MTFAVFVVGFLCGASLLAAGLAAVAFFLRAQADREWTEDPTHRRRPPYP